jgi:ribosomal protein S8
MNHTTINFLVALKNASMTHKEQCTFSENTFCNKILILLYKEGFVQSFKYTANNVVIQLRYKFNQSIFKNLVIMSKPSKVVICSSKTITLLTYKTKFSIVSTSKGLKTGLECKKENLGGQLLFIC